MADMGMTISEIRALARSLRARAEEVDGLVNHLSSRVEVAPWLGNDRDRFVRDWDGHHGPGLRAVAEALREAAVEAERAAAAQAQVSGQ